MRTAALLLAAALAAAAQSPNREVSLITSSPTALAASLHGAGYDVLPVASTNEVRLIVSPTEERALREAGHQPRVIRDGRPYAGLVAEGSVPSGYPDLTQVLGTINATAANHPSICQVVSLTATYGAPLTYEGREIHAVRISDNVAVEEDEPRVLIVSAHHCRELVTPVIALDTIDRLTSQYGIDPAITALVDDNEIWIIPVMNPDGYEYVFSTDNFWRKNRRPVGEDVGIDLNRNYPVGWDESCGGSTTVAWQTYRGPAPASEAETQTMMALASDRRFFKVMDIHSYALEVRQGYGCWNHPWDAFIQAEATTLANAAGYSLAPSCCLGGHIHWEMVEHGALSFLYETSTQFQPPYSSALAEATTVWPSTLAFLQRPATLTGNVTDAVTGQPLAAEIQLLDVGFDHGERFRAEATHGRFDGVVPPGDYTLRVMHPGHLAQVHPVTIGTGLVTVTAALVPASPDTGQANTTPAALTIGGATDRTGAAPADQNGPYFAWLMESDELHITMAGTPSQAVVLLAGGLNRNNATFPGVGSLDLGSNGAIGDYSDIEVAMDGVNPTTLLDAFAGTGPSGSQNVVVTIPGGLVGATFSLQALVTQPAAPPLLTAACEVVIL